MSLVIGRALALLAQRNIHTHKKISMEPQTQGAAPASNDPWGDVEAVETDMIKFDTVGKSVVGVVLSRKETPTKYGESPLYRLFTTEGEAAMFATSLLDDKLIGQVGKIVKITFTETKPSSKGNDAKLFEVKSVEDSEENRVKYGIVATW